MQPGLLPEAVTGPGRLPWRGSVPGLDSGRSGPLSQPERRVRQGESCLPASLQLAVGAGGPALANEEREALGGLRGPLLPRGAALVSGRSQGREVGLGGEGWPGSVSAEELPPHSSVGRKGAGWGC